MTAGSPPAPSASASRRGGDSMATTFAVFRRYLPALVVFVLVLVAWQLQTQGTGRRVIPPPTSILAALSSSGQLLWKSAMATFYEALGGLLIGTLLGTAVGFATSRWVTARDLLLPIAIGASAVPLIAISPILNNWFGVLDPFSKMTMAALLVFFPITISVTRGLVEVGPSSLELMRSYATSPGEVMRKVRIPNMLPFFFTALKVSTTLAFIGAIVGEFYGGTSEVLGRVVLTSISGGSYDVAWAAVLIGSVGAIGAYFVVAMLERWAIPWYTQMRAGSG
jgi:NitT/TauT family transport system permease protein